MQKKKVKTKSTNLFAKLKICIFYVLGIFLFCTFLNYIFIFKAVLQNCQFNAIVSCKH